MEGSCSSSPEDAETLYHIKKRQQREIPKVQEAYALIRGLPVAFNVHGDVEGRKNAAPSSLPSDADAHNYWNLV